jgi:hypothetical protein
MTLLQSLLICLFILSPLHASVITLYPGSTTYIYEQYPIANTGTNTGLVSALPAGISPIEISATGLTSASFFPESQVSDFLAARIGRSVQLEKSGFNEGPYIFKGLFDSSYVLQKKDEIRFVPKDTPLIFEKADLPQNSSLLLSFSKKPASTVTLGYFMPNVTSEVRYLLSHEPKTTKATLNAEIWIQNLSERTFSDTSITVKVGNAPQAEVPHPMVKGARAADMRLTTEQVLGEGEIVYELTTPTTLFPQTKTRLPLIPETPIAISTLYKLDLGGVQENFTPLRRVLRFRNTTGKALANGQLYYFTKGVLQQIGKLPVTLPDQLSEIDNGSAFALLGKKLSGPLSENKEDTGKKKPTQHTITLRNDGGSIVEIEVRDYIPSNQTILHASHAYTRISSYQILFKLTLDMGKETMITYITREE